MKRLHSIINFLLTYSVSYISVTKTEFADLDFNKSATSYNFKY